MEADDLRRCTLSLEGDGVYLRYRVKARGSSRHRADEYLAGRGRARKTCRDVHSIPEWGHLRVSLIANRADPGETGVHARTDGSPRSRGIRVPGRAHECLRSLDGLRRMQVTRHEREEHRHDLVADELVDGAIVVEDDGRGGRVEAIEQGMELRRRHVL